VNAVQPILAVLLIGAVILYRARMRSRLADRLIVLTLATVGLVLIVFPDLSTRVAHFLGVGRGVDLVFYLSIVGIGFFLMLFLSRIRALESQLTAVARELALFRAVVEKQAQTSAGPAAKRRPMSPEHDANTARPQEIQRKDQRKGDAT
jgi:small membrane protein